MTTYYTGMVGWYGHILSATTLSHRMVRARFFSQSALTITSYGFASSEPARAEAKRSRSRHATRCPHKTPTYRVGRRPYNTIFRIIATSPEKLRFARDSRSFYIYIIPVWSVWPLGRIRGHGAKLIRALCPAMVRHGRLCRSASLRPESSSRCCSSCVYSSWPPGDSSRGCGCDTVVYRPCIGDLALSIIDRTWAIGRCPRGPLPMYCRA